MDGQENKLLPNEIESFFWFQSDFSDWTTDYEPKLIAGRDAVDDFKCGRRVFFRRRDKIRSKVNELLMRLSLRRCSRVGDFV